MQRNVYFGEIRKNPLASFPLEYFSPTPLECEISLSSHAHAQVAFAQEALGVLRGFSDARPMVLAAARLAAIQDSLNSSRIEGTKATLGEVLIDETQPSARRDVAEVRNLIRATEFALQARLQYPIGVRLMRRIHEILMSDASSASKTPGEFRKSFVWIGQQGGSIEQAELIPPAASELAELLHNWEIYVNECKSEPTVIRNAMAHYQFETIHPFLDGNGRVGRLMAMLMLVEDGSLAHPVLSLSRNIEMNRDAYYNALREVRTSGDMGGWVEFWAIMIRFAAEDATDRLRKLSALADDFASEAPNKAMQRFIEVMFHNPIVSVSGTKSQLKLATSTAAGLIARAVTLGWLVPLGDSRQGARQFWVSTGIWKIITNEPLPLDEALL